MSFIPFYFSSAKLSSFLTHKNWIFLQDGHDADNTKQSTADMTVFVSSLTI